MWRFAICPLSKHHPKTGGTDHDFWNLFQGDGPNSGTPVLFRTMLCFFAVFSRTTMRGNMVYVSIISSSAWRPTVQRWYQKSYISGRFLPLKATFLFRPFLRVVTPVFIGPILYDVLDKSPKLKPPYWLGVSNTLLIQNYYHKGIFAS